MLVTKVHYEKKESPVEFVKSLKNTGFGIIENHPIPIDLINKVYKEWSEFFESEKKYNYLFDPEKQDGYFPLGTENAKNYDIKDHKEFYHFYPWGRIPKDLSGSTIDLYNILVEITSTLLGWVDTHSPKEIITNFSEPLKNMIKGSKTNLFRIIHYPPFLGSENKKSFRAAAHEDINLITLLVAGTKPGLEAKATDGTWHKISTDPGTIIVNVGDMLQEVSSGFYPSTTHRVTNPDENISNESRYSMPLFLHPRDEVILSNKYTAKEYLKKRLVEIGLKTN